MFPKKAQEQFVRREEQLDHLLDSEPLPDRRRFSDTAGKAMRNLSMGTDSDWTSDNTGNVFRNLKLGEHYYNFQQRTVQDFRDEVEEKGFKPRLAERLAWGEMFLVLLIFSQRKYVSEMRGSIRL